MIVMASIIFWAAALFFFFANHFCTSYISTYHHSSFAQTFLFGDFDKSDFLSSSFPTVFQLFQAHYSKSQIFVQKFNFDKTPTFSRVFHPNFFDNFLGKSKLNFWTKNEDFKIRVTRFFYNLMPTHYAFRWAHISKTNVRQNQLILKCKQSGVH